ncbi:hypothetical protein IQ07DRAFT_590340 [Pyrenochaeta sp. DS3sAY3a]|nr:hypothetical protein IQ07DRAFT_590340 [Pyrenochaeta sp. DS3sAY3a]
MQRELEHAFISKARPFLSAQSSWKNAIRFSEGYTQAHPLRLKTTYEGHGPNALLTKLHIVLPVIKGLGFSIFDTDSTSWYSYLLRILRPLLQAPCPTLIITLYPTVRDIREKSLHFCFAVQMYKTLIEAARYREDRTIRYFAHTRRLIFNYGNQEDCVDLDELISGFQPRYMHPRARIMPLPLQSWIVRDQTGPQDERGWKVVHDFENIVQDFEGDVWKIEMDDLGIRAMKPSSLGGGSGWETDHVAGHPLPDLDSEFYWG